MGFLPLRPRPNHGQQHLLSRLRHQHLRPPGHDHQQHNLVQWPAVKLDLWPAICRLLLGYQRRRSARRDHRHHERPLYPLICGLQVSGTPSTVYLTNSLSYTDLGTGTYFGNGSVAFPYGGDFDYILENFAAPGNRIVLGPGTFFTYGSQYLNKLVQQGQTLQGAVRHDAAIGVAHKRAKFRAVVRRKWCHHPEPHDRVRYQLSQQRR